MCFGGEKKYWRVSQRPVAKAGGENGWWQSQGKNANCHCKEHVSQSFVLGQEEHWSPRLECRLEGVIAVVFFFRWEILVWTYLLTKGTVLVYRWIESEDERGSICEMRSPEETGEDEV